MPFATLRATAVRELIDVAGPSGDGLAMRMEKTRSMPELQPLLVLATRMMTELGARAAAERYTMRFLTGV
jgi:ribose 1,5-bisphosphokinase PhnN